VTDKKLRLFLAVNLSLATTRKLGEAVDRLRRVSEGKLRVAWVAQPNLHVTLKFLGWSNPEVVGAIVDRVREGVKGKKGIDVTARGLGAFPSERHPRVLWAGVKDPSGQLARLAADVEGWMEKLGYEKEQRAFHPHVTIGRVKEGGSAEELLAPWKEVEFGPSLIREVVLYESRMKSTGSEYTALARIPLDAPPWRAERQSREVEGESTDSEE
jgi:2'-5' RNA ligase